MSLEIPDIDDLPEAPSPDDSSTAFDAKAFAWAAALAVLVTQFNASKDAFVSAASDLLNAIFSGTSTTSNTIASSGTKNWTTQTGLGFSPGQTVIVAQTSAPANYMTGTIASYDGESGALAVSVGASGGSGSAITDWSIGLTPAGDALLKGGGTMTGLLVAAASASGGAGFRLSAGAAPSAPSDGDVWLTTSGVFARVNGTTQQLLAVAGGTMTGLLVTLASATGGAGLRLPHGAAPSAPSNGDLWTTTSGVFIRVNGATFQLASFDGPETLTNKRITKRVVAAGATSGTLTPNADATDVYKATGLTGTVTFGAPSGTPTDEQRLEFYVEDNGTGRTINWNAIYRAEQGVALPSGTTANKHVRVAFIYNASDTKWDLVAAVREA